MAATIRQELEEEFLSTIRKGQETALEAARPLAEAVHYVIPAMPAVRVPLAGLLPTAEEAAVEAAAPVAVAVQYVIRAMPAVRVPGAGLLPTAREAVAGGYEFAGHLLANQRQRRKPQFPALPRSVVRGEGDGP